DSILGQFDPGAVDRSVNPWDYLLMMEGALVFASAAVKRHELSDKGILSYPFCVRSAGVGYGSSTAADEDSCRAEMWLPLWTKPCGLAEIRILFSEGRAQVNGRSARNGVDFARAIATLGTDRGIEQFVRFGFHARNGLAYFAVPLGRFLVRHQPQVDLLNEEKLDTWIESFRRAASSDNAPSRALRALNRLETAILKLCQQKGAAQLQAVLIALGEAESVLAKSPKWRDEAYQRPVPLLSPEWLVQCDDHSEEFRLAASLAGIYGPAVGTLRQHLEPVEVKPFGATWSESSNAANNVVWSEGDLERNLIAVFARRSIEAVKQNERAPDGTLVFPGQFSCSASLGDVAAFLTRNVNDEQINALLRGLILLNWPQVRQQDTASKMQPGDNTSSPDAIFTILKLCHVPYHIYDKYIPLTPQIARLAAAGRLDEATKMSLRRLTGSSLKPILRTAAQGGKLGRRLAAALLFPISSEEMHKLAKSVLAKPEHV
ncbi:MAG: type I-U CRISPR-associated protein Csx17, partial [Planctomycetota bacterium]